MKRLMSPHVGLFATVFWLAVLITVTRQQQQQVHHQSAAGGGGGRQANRARQPASSSSKPRRTEKPNIVFIITDDQDIELGSLNFMPKLARWMREGGTSFNNAFVTTPMCCPSRSSMLTGMYVHNHFTYTNNDNCSSEQWRQTHETRNFGTYLTGAGYRTGYFGKYLNEYTGAYIPPGWTEWMGLIRNTRFYNYSVNYNGQKIKHEADYYKDYLTDLIANHSVRFLRDSKQYFPNRPVAMVLSMPAPHGPEDSAPQYQRMFFDVKTHRTPSWNFAPNPDKQWLLQYTGKMTPIQIAFTDLLHTKRLQTLQSVDDAVQKVCEELDALGELDNTYVIYTSDHGYHLGQYGLVKGKAMPYEFDIRVPFFMRGPKIPANSSMPQIVLNLDIAPTLLDIAGVPAPDHMDGSSVLKLFDGHQNSFSGVRRRRVWRDTFLVERGKLTVKKLKVQEKLEARVNRLVITKDQRLEDECQKPQYQSPCKHDQQWECRRNADGKLRVYKCRLDGVNGRMVSTTPPGPPLVRTKCSCPHDRPMNAHEVQRQLEFLQHHVNKPLRMQEPRFIPERYRRDVRARRVPSTSTSLPATTSTTTAASATTTTKTTATTTTTTEAEATTDILFPVDADIFNESYFELPDKVSDLWTDEGNNDYDQISDEVFTVSTPTPLDTDWVTIETTDTGSERSDMAIPCRVVANGTVMCERFVYTSADGWNAQKRKIERIVRSYRQRMSILRTIYNHLLKLQPSQPSTLASIVSTSHRVTIRRPIILTTLPTPTTTVAAGGTGQTTTRSSEKVEELKSIDTEAEEDEDCICDDEDAVTASEAVHQPGGSRDRRLEDLARRVASQDEREKRRKIKTEKRRNSRKSKKGKPRRTGKETEVSFDCNSPDVSCSAPVIEPPFLAGSARPPVNPWDGVDMSKFSSRRDPMCNVEGLECSRMDDEHWKVPPFWTHGPFCICPNSNNNTYWCLRTVNDSHNFLYCEFITGFISFYDMTRDPNQLRNAVHDLSFGLLHQLHDILELMKGCKGARKCNLRHKADNDERESWKNVEPAGSPTKINDHANARWWLRTRHTRHSGS